MHVLLTIGCWRYLLPDDKGVHTVIRTLAKAQEVKHDRRRTEGRIELGERPEVGIEYLPGYRFVRKPQHCEVIEPEVLPPHQADLPTSSPGRLVKHVRHMLTEGRET